MVNQYFQRLNVKNVNNITLLIVIISVNFVVVKLNFVIIALKKRINLNVMVVRKDIILMSRVMSVNSVKKIVCLVQKILVISVLKDILLVMINV